MKIISIAVGFLLFVGILYWLWLSSQSAERLSSQLLSVLPENYVMHETIHSDDSNQNSWEAIEIRPCEPKEGVAPMLEPECFATMVIWQEIDYSNDVERFVEKDKDLSAYDKAYENDEGQNFISTYKGFLGRTHIVFTTKEEWRCSSINTESCSRQRYVHQFSYYPFTVVNVELSYWPYINGVRGEIPEAVKQTIQECTRALWE